jgi:hypothetical protein
VPVLHQFQITLPCSFPIVLTILELQLLQVEQLGTPSLPIIFASNNVPPQ